MHSYSNRYKERSILWHKRETFLLDNNRNHIPKNRLYKVNEVVNVIYDNWKRIIFGYLIKFLSIFPQLRNFTIFLVFWGETCFLFKVKDPSCEYSLPGDHVLNCNMMTPASFMRGKFSGFISYSAARITGVP